MDPRQVNENPESDGRGNLQQAVPETPPEPVFDDDDAQVWPPRKHVVEPEDEDYSLEPRDEGRILDTRPLPTASKEVVLQMRDQRIAYYTAQGHSVAWITKKIKAPKNFVAARLRQPRVQRMAVAYQRDIVNHVKADLFRVLSKALRVQEEHMEIAVPKDLTKMPAYMTKVRHELKAAQFITEKALEFIQHDHALLRLDEKLFGPRESVSGPAVAVQINNTEQPNERVRAYAEIMRHIPEEHQLVVSERLRKVMLEEEKANAAAKR